MDWRDPENITSTITLYRQPREESFEDKEWTFFVEAVRKCFIIVIDHTVSAAVNCNCWHSYISVGWIAGASH